MSKFVYAVLTLSVPFFAPVAQAAVHVDISLDLAHIQIEGPDTYPQVGFPLSYSVAIENKSGQDSRSDSSPLTLHRDEAGSLLHASANDEAITSSLDLSAGDQANAESSVILRFTRDLYSVRIPYTYRLSRDSSQEFAYARIGLGQSDVASPDLEFYFYAYSEDDKKEKTGSGYLSFHPSTRFVPVSVFAQAYVPSIPEPSTVALSSLGLSALLLRRCRRG